MEASAASEGDDGPVAPHGDGVIRYDAFLSYAHADDERGIVSLVQQTLRQIAKPWHRRSALRVFRDETALSASPELWGSIATAIDGSAWFVLFASPAAAASEWVDREVAHWLSAHGTDHLLTVLVGGTWAWDARQGDFDPTCTAVPPSLRGSLRSEPRHIDLTWAVEGALPSPRDPRWRDDIAELAAPMHGLSKEDLTGADLRAHRRTLRIARGAAAVLAVLALVAAGAALVAVRKADQARENQARAEAARDEAEYRTLVAQARDLRASKRDLALLLAVEARHLRASPESDGAVQAAILQDPRLLATTVDPDAAAPFSDVCAFTGTSTAIAAGRDGTFSVIDLAAGRRVDEPVRPPGATEEDPLGCTVNPDGSGALSSVSGAVWPLVARGGAVLLGDPVDVGAGINQVAVAPGGERIAVGTLDGRLVQWSRGEGERAAATQETDKQIAVGVAYSPDGTTLAAAGRTEIRLRSVTTDEVLAAIPTASGDQAGGLVDLPEPFRQLEYDATGTRLIDNRRAIVRAYDPATGRERWSAPNPFAATSPFALAPDGETLVLADDIGDQVRVSSDTGEALGSPIHPTEESYAAFVSEAGDQLVLASYDSPSLTTWALDGRSSISSAIGAAGREVVSVSPDSSAIAVIDAGVGVVGQAEVFDVRSGASLGRVGETAFPTLLARDLLAGFFLDRLAVARWDLAADRYRGPSYPVELAGLVTADATSVGEVVIGYEDGTIRRYGGDGQEIGDPFATVAGARFIDVTLSASGDRVAIQTVDGGSVVLDGRDGHQIVQLDDAYVSSFSEDDRQMAVFRAAGVLELRSMDTGDLVEQLRVDSSYAATQTDISSYLFASSGSDVQLYDWETLTEVGEPFPSVGASLALPDGSGLVTSTDDQILVWNLDPDRWEEAACEMAGRNLTAAERAQYLPRAASGAPTCPQWTFRD